MGHTAANAANVAFKQRRRGQGIVGCQAAEVLHFDNYEQAVERIVGIDAAHIGSDPTRIVLHVNGVNLVLHTEPQTTLAEALRGQLGLVGTKIAHNRGACSACTVWLDGAPVCACMLLVIDVGKRSVTTIEGLADGDELHPIQNAFIDERLAREAAKLALDDATPLAAIPA